MQGCIVEVPRGLLAMRWFLVENTTGADLKCYLLLLFFWKQLFEGLEKGVGFRIALSEVKRLRRGCVDLSGGFCADLGA